MDDLGWEIDNEYVDDEQDGWDDDDYYADDLDDDEPREPNCFDCHDTGIDRRDRACRSCRPSRLRVWWWSIQGWFWRLKRRARRSEVDDPWGPPF